jgi:hypothetical protein
MAAPISWSDLVEALMAAPTTAASTISWMDLVEAAVSTGNLHRLKGNTYILPITASDYPSSFFSTALPLAI